MAHDIKAIAAPFKQQLVDYRRHFHMHPELSFHETETSAFIKKQLTRIGVDIKPGISGNSVVAVIDSGVAGPGVAFRADMDALGLTELNEAIPYCSQNKGVMHGCGHDAHTSILLNLVEAFYNNKNLIKKGKVVFLFQQAEEKIPGGAKTMVEEGALDGVNYVFGLHVTTSVPVGTVAVSVGPQSAAADAMYITIQGKGGHGADPHNALDPISAGASLIQELQYIPSKFKDPMLPIVVNICSFHAGDAFNVIPDSAKLSGTMRTFNEDLRQRAAEKIKAICQGLEITKNLKIDLDFQFGYPALLNPEKETALVKAGVAELGYNNAESAAQMGGEDFAYFLQKVPGCFFMLGTGNKDKGITATAHNPRFDIDEDALIVGLECMLKTYDKLSEPF